MLLSSGQCTDQCPQGQYAAWSSTTSSMNCVPCPQANCITCNLTSCQGCQTGDYLFHGECVAACPAGTYASGSSCLNCTIVGCKQCNSTNCQVCLDTLLNVYANGSSTITSCDNVCPSRHYLVNGRNCQECPVSCDVCSSASNCSVCATGYFLYNNQCYQPCPTGTYLLPTGGACGPCPTGCTACTSLTDCTTCGDYYTLVNGICIQPNCLNCDNCTNNYCFNCTAPFLQLNGTCLITCPTDYYFANETNCADCMQNCLLCPNASFCEICVSSYNYTNVTNECIPEAVFVYGRVANMSTFTSNLTNTMSAVYLTSSTGPVVFGEMSSTYFNIEFLQFMFFHNTAASNNPEVSKFLDSLSLMSFQLPIKLIPDSSNNSQNATTSRRLLVSAAAQSVSNSFLVANQSIILLMLIFTAIYIVVLLTQKYMDACFARCPKARFYSNEVCEFLLKRFKWAYVDFIMWLSYMPFLFFALVQLQVIAFDTADKAISSVISIVIIIAYPVYPFFIAWLIKSHYAALEVPDSDTLLEMSMAPYVGKINRDKVSLAYYPLKYLRKLLFCIFVATISNGLVVLGLLIGINVAFLLFICIKRPHSSKLFLGFDIAIEAVLLGFEIFMMVYVTQGGDKVDLMSIITHSLGFLMANASLVIAIILNLIAYYKIIMCVWELVKHLRAKNEEREQVKNIEEMLQEEKQLAGFKRGDELTEHGDALVDDANFDLEKFQHGVHFGDPGDYVDHPENVDQYLFDEKEFFNMNEAGLHSDLNNPANNPSSEFENSDNQLMEIIRNKKKPTPRVTVDRVVKANKGANAVDDFAQLGNKVAELVPEEIGVKKFKKQGAKERGIPDLSTTDFNTKNDEKKGEKVRRGLDEKVGVGKGAGFGDLNTKSRKANGNPLDDLEEVNSMDEAEIREREGQFRKGARVNDKDSEEESSSNLSKHKQFKKKARRAGASKDESISNGGSVDSQENLIMSKEYPTKRVSPNNYSIDNNTENSPEGIFKKRDKKARDMENIRRGLDELEHEDIGGETHLNLRDRQGKSKQPGEARLSNFASNADNDLDSFELRAESRGGKRGNGSVDSSGPQDELQHGNIRDREHRKAQSKGQDDKRLSTNEVKGLNTVNKNFGGTGSVVSKNFFESEDDPWNTGRMVEHDSKKADQDLRKNYNTVDMHTKKSDDNDGNNPATVDSKL